MGLLLALTPKEDTIKGKANKFYFIKIKGHCKENEKETHGMAENICKSCI